MLRDTVLCVCVWHWCSLNASQLESLGSGLTRLTGTDMYVHPSKTLLFIAYFTAGVFGFIAYWVDWRWHVCSPGATLLFIAGSSEKLGLEVHGILGWLTLVCVHPEETLLFITGASEKLGLEVHGILGWLTLVCVHPEETLLFITGASEKLDLEVHGILGWLTLVCVHPEETLLFITGSSEKLGLQVHCILGWLTGSWCS